MSRISKKYSEEDYINTCLSFGLKYVGCHKEKKGTAIDFVCQKHPDKGVQSKDWSHLRISKKPCGYCNGRYRDTEDAQRLVKNSNIKLISPYIGSEKPIKCRCDICGNEWVSSRPLDLFKRDGGCPYCADIKRGKYHAKSHDDFVGDLYSVNPDIIVIGKYSGAHSYVRCKCKIHGCEWESYACNLLNRSAGCPICNNSVGENEIIDTLNCVGVHHIEEKSFPGCNDIKPLRFDVFDVDNNIAYEFQGEQHYYPVDFSHNNPTAARIEFESLKRRDLIKKNYCMEHGIRLICIPYWKRGSVKEYILEELKIYTQEENTA